MKFCPECGTQLNGTMRFCPECGYSLVVSSHDPFGDIDHEELVFHIEKNIAKSKTLQKSYSFAKEKKMTIDEALSLLYPQYDFLSRLCNRYPEYETYRELYNAIRFIIEGLKQGIKTSLSLQDGKVLCKLASFWLSVADILDKKNSNEYQSDIDLCIKYAEDINVILKYGIAETTQTIPSSEQKRTVQNPNTEDFDPLVLDEINCLQNELQDLKPNFKRERYNPSMDYRQELHKLIGLDNLKSSIDDHIIDFKIQLERKKVFPDLKVTSSFNCIFKGKPGTGKTTVARLLSGLLKQEGLISNGCYVEADASSLVSGYVGFSAKVAKLAALESFGGVLFIDEAYSLMNSKGSKSNAGAEVIDTLTPLMENHRDKLTVVLAGYDKEMEEFLANSNTGFPSRFKSVFQFEDYTDELLLDIFLKFAESEHYTLTPEAQKRVRTILWFIISQKNEMRQFANARTARNLYEYVRAKSTKRIAQEGLSDLSTIKLEDVDLERSEIDMITNKY